MHSFYCFISFSENLHTPLKPEAWKHRRMTMAEIYWQTLLLIAPFRRSYRLYQHLYFIILETFGFEHAWWVFWGEGGDLGPHFSCWKVLPQQKLDLLLSLWKSKKTSKLACELHCSMKNDMKPIYINVTVSHGDENKHKKRGKSSILKMHFRKMIVEQQKWHFQKEVKICWLYKQP